MLWILGADAIGGALMGVGGDSAHAGGPSPTLGPIAGSVARVCQFLGTQLEHVDWDGFRFYDLIFPLFLFIIGVSLVFSLDKLRSQHGDTAARQRVFKRSAILYVLGLFYYGGISAGWDQIRLLGVLQRLALCYAAASCLHLKFSNRGLLTLSAGILLIYWALLAWVPVPGIGPANQNPDTNLAHWFDSKFLPLKKWDGDHDPEGILSTFPAIVTCVLGVLAGRFLKGSELTGNQRALALIVVGLGLVLVGNVWGLAFPIIKKIWTSSYVLVAGGWSLILLGVFHGLIDTFRVRRWAQVFVWIGLNPITLYLLGNVLNFDNVARRLIGGPVEAGLNHGLPGLGSLLVAIGGISTAILVAWFLNRKRIYLRV